MSERAVALGESVDRIVTADLRAEVHAAVVSLLGSLVHGARRTVW